MSTSHASTLDDGGIPKERYQRYHEEKAKGGIALTMFGGSSMVSRDSSWGGGQIDVSDDAIIPWLRQFSERIHGHGAAIMCQISHLGRRADAMGWNWLPTIGPSPIRETRHRNFPREMDRHDIDRVVREYAAAAKRCQEGGLDGVETVTGGHLIGQFFSPRTNRRTDAFGGSIENRARFGLMVHEAIRKAVGDDWLVGIRFVVDEATEDGIDFDECVRIAHLFEREGHIDFFNAHLRPHGHRPRARRAQHARHVAAAGAFPAAGRPLQARGEAAGVPRRAHPGHRHGAPRDRRGAARHGGDDARAHGRSADRQQAHARRGGAHPSLRRRVLLHVEEGRLPAQPGIGARGDPAAGHRALPPRRAARWSLSAAARPGWKRRASAPSAAIPWCCSRRAPGSAASC